MPTGNVSPEAASPEIVELQLSSVVGAVQVATAPQMPASFVKLMLAGIPEIVGFSVSCTVMVATLVEVFPHSSVTVRVTELAPVSAHVKEVTSMDNVTAP